MRNLVPEIRTDKNGNQITRWVKPSKSKLIASLVPAPSLNAPKGEIPADELVELVRRGVSMRGSSQWIDDRATVDNAYESSDYQLLKILAANVHTDERLSEIEQLRYVLAANGCHDAVEVLTPKNIESYSSIKEELRHLPKLNYEERGELCALFLTSNPNDQSLIKDIFHVRKVTHPDEVKKLLDEMHSSGLSVSSGVL